MLATISCQVWRARESSGMWDAASKAALQCLLMDWARIFALSSWCTGSTAGRVAGSCSGVSGGAGGSGTWCRRWGRRWRPWWRRLKMKRAFASFDLLNIDRISRATVNHREVAVAPPSSLQLRTLQRVFYDVARCFLCRSEPLHYSNASAPRVLKGPKKIRGKPEKLRDM